MNISPRGLDDIKQSEGLRLKRILAGLAWAVLSVMMLET